MLTTLLVTYTGKRVRHSRDPATICRYLRSSRGLRMTALIRHRVRASRQPSRYLPLDISHRNNERLRFIMTTNLHVTLLSRTFYGPSYFIHLLFGVVQVFS